MKKAQILKMLVYNRIAVLLPNFPDHRYSYKIFENIRQFFWRKLFKKIGPNTFIRSKVQILGYHNISMGKDSIIGPGSIINATAEIKIGNYFLSGPELIIYTAEHGIQNDGIPFIKQEGNTARVNIGNNVYLGARVIILSGVTIGDNVVVGPEVW